MGRRTGASTRSIVETVVKIRHVEERGDIRQDEALYAASLRFLQTRSEATQTTSGRARLDAMIEGTLRP